MGGDTPLHESLKGFGNEKTALALAEHADVNVRNKEGQAPLHLAAERGYVRVIELLIERGADVDARDNGGNTLLHYAARGCKAAAAKLLLKRGANPTAKNANGETPLDVAKKQYEKYRGYCDSPSSCWAWLREIEECAITLRVLTETAAKP